MVAAKGLSKKPQESNGAAKAHYRKQPLPLNGWRPDNSDWSRRILLSWPGGRVRRIELGTVWLARRTSEWASQPERTTPGGRNLLRTGLIKALSGQGSPVVRAQQLPVHGQRATQITDSVRF